MLTSRVLSKILYIKPANMMNVKLSGREEKITYIC